MVETLLEKPLRWLDASGAQAEFVVFSSGTLARNMADLPFPARCSDEELHTAEERLLNVLEAEGFLSRGQYCPSASLDPREVLFLQERDLISPEFANREGPRGVYVSEDQYLSIMINELDHVKARAHASGLELDQVWTRLNALDDALMRGLDYAFEEKLGFLTSAVGNVGTALVLRVVMHLPGLAMSNQILAAQQRLREEHHALRALSLTGTVRQDDAHAPGDLFELRNTATLGRSEAEIVFHLNHAANELIRQEKEAREALMREGQRGLEDRIGRARGIAREARLLEAAEADAVLSSLRLGISSGLLEGITLRQLNNTLIAARRGHLEMRLGQDCDDLTLSVERADLFRSRFS
jgi:protein arginine kinase